MGHLAAIVSLTVAVVIWGLLMVRRQQDKAELGVAGGDDCHGCARVDCSRREA